MKIHQTLLFFACLLQTSVLLAQKQEVKNMTHAYYAVKNALIADDGATASKQAALFLASLDAVSNIEMSTAQRGIWQENLVKMKTAGARIQATTTIALQREQLNELSTALFAALKTLNTNEEPVYYQYCPMKKAYWLSNEKEIKNPYYGKKMLTCGSVKETLK